jgi:excisionase family DNA binding protein
MPRMTEGNTERYTVREAADVLGISEHAIRQRIRRGTLRSTKDVEGRVYVLLDRGARESSAEPSDKTSGETSGTDPMRMLREQNRLLREQLDEAHAANRENRRIIAALASRIPQLEPPREEPLEPRGSSLTDSDDPANRTPEEPITREEPTSQRRERGWLWRIFIGEG